MSAEPPAASPPAQPYTSTLASLKPHKSKLKEIVERAQVEALLQLQELGGAAAARVGKLASLSGPRFFEQLAVRPPVGPSTIAAPKPGTTVPSPSVNYVGSKGGTTAGHPGVVLLLAKQAGDDTFYVYCTGTLIRQNVILTATHCVCYSPQPTANYPTGQYCLQGDANTTRSPLLDPTRWRAFFQYAGVREITHVEINDQYEFDKTAVRADIALFVLGRAVGEINPPATPALSDAPSTWSGGAIVGFGYTANPKKPGTNLLQQLVLPGLKAQGQVLSAPCSTQRYLDPRASLCSIYRGPGGGSQATNCTGDSGGPLWLTDPSEADIGVTSGRTDEDCTAANTLGFQMSTAYSTHWNWIETRLAQYAAPAVKGRWPTFGENLLYVLDKRNFGAFDDTGLYQSDGWMTAADTNPILGTVNSSAALTHFELQGRDGKTLCSGVAGAAHQLPNVDYCWASMTAGTQFHVIARGGANEFLQFVVSTHAPGTSFLQ